MKRLVIICEGQTEHEFCNDLLSDELKNHFDTMDFPLIKHSGGGIVAWSRLKNQIIRHLSENNNTYVTTFIDYYGLTEELGYPSWAEAEACCDKIEKMKLLEQGMKNDIPGNVNYRFIPYIQLHEFESLLYSNINVFREEYDEKDIDYAELESVASEFPTPEDINNGRRTAPSKRILHAVPGYNKVLDGNALAMDIGLEEMKNKCLHFKEWIKMLKNV